MQSNWDNIIRNTLPLELKIALLAVIGLLALMYSANSSWITTNRLLASLPIQRFKWKTETYLNSSLNRFGSLVTSAIILSILVRSYFLSPQENFMLDSSIYFIGLCCLIILLFLFKWLSMSLYFRLHQQEEIGTLSLDYQYAFNQLVGILVFALLCLDLLYFHFDSPIKVILIYVIALAYLARLFGHIALLINNLSYPLLSLFIYLCTFEIAPALVITKVLFENS